jgi:putative transposase
LEYECVYLNVFETGSEARTGIGRWVAYYNADRPHSVFAGRTPDEVYATHANEERLAAQSNPESTFAKPPFCPAKRDHLSEGRTAASGPSLVQLSSTLLLCLIDLKAD